MPATAAAVEEGSANPGKLCRRFQRPIVTPKDGVQSGAIYQAWQVGPINIRPPRPPRPCPLAPCPPTAHDKYTKRPAAALIAEMDTSSPCARQEMHSGSHSTTQLTPLLPQVTTQHCRSPHKPACPSNNETEEESTELMSSTPDASKRSLTLAIPCKHNKREGPASTCCSKTD